MATSASYQRWPESFFQTPTPLFFQNFGIRARIRFRQFLKFENPTPVQTPATIINPTLIYPCFYLKNDHTDSCYCRNWKVTPNLGPVFLKFWLQVWKKKRIILPESTPVPDPVPPLPVTTTCEEITWREVPVPFFPNAKLARCAWKLQSRFVGVIFVAAAGPKSFSNIFEDRTLNE